METPMLKIINEVKKIAARKEDPPPDTPIKNIVITDISMGNLPLQGTKLFVSIASSRSLGESIILQPTTPAALQPKPMQTVSACFPHEPQRLNGLSEL